MVIGGIVAGGVGRRMGHGDLPKQFMKLHGKPVVIHTIEKFFMCTCIDYVIVAVPPEWTQFMTDLIAKSTLDTSKLRIISGGETRNGTIEKIVEQAKRLGATGDDIVLTHDAVRPFLSVKILENNIEAAREYGACDTVIPSTDTIVNAEDELFITQIPLRKTMFQGQTPQSFKVSLYETLMTEVTKQEMEESTDVCRLFNLHGYPVRLVQGDVTNLKITYATDFKMAELMMGDIAVDLPTI